MSASPSRLRELLASQPRVCVLTGAGISAESGVPTFRDPDGLWARFKPEELASMAAFLRNPELVWEWYQHRLHVIRNVQPNPGHYALVAMSRHFTNFTLVTQNVDNLHQRAGHERVIELHGNIDRSYCMSCGTFAAPLELEKFSAENRVPRCRACGDQLRPDVVWFGEMLPTAALETATRAATDCDLFLSVGTSGAVYPAAGLPLLAKESGAYVVEINPRPTEISGAMNACLRGPSGEILPELLREAMGTTGP